MADITAQLVSVDRMIWSGKASIVTAQTTEGEIGVLPGHEPMLGQLKDNGVVTINPVDGERIVAAVQGGFLSVVDNKVTVLADWATLSSEVNSSEAQSKTEQDDDEVTKMRGQAELAAMRRANQ